MEKTWLFLLAVLVFVGYKFLASGAPPRCKRPPCPLQWTTDPVIAMLPPVTAAMLPVTTAPVIPVLPVGDPYTKGLVFTLNEAGNSYTVSGYTGTDTEVVIPSFYQEKPVLSIGNNAFYECERLTSITIPDSITSIGEMAFALCVNLTSIELPGSVSSFGKVALSGCFGLKDITVAEHNTVFCSIDGNLYTKNGKRLIQYAIGKSNTSFTVPDTVTLIGEGALAFCSNLISIQVPASVTSIGAYAFRFCTGLTNVTFGENSRLALIGDYAFGDCDSLTNVAFGENSQLTSISRAVFSSCSNLKSIEIPSKVTSIGDLAFRDCTALTIYAEVTEKPSGWNNGWNFSNCPVVWGYKG